MVDLHENETAIEVFDVSIDHKDSNDQPVYVKAFTDIKPEMDKAPKFSNQSKLGLAVNRLFTDKDLALFMDLAQRAEMTRLKKSVKLIHRYILLILKKVLIPLMVNAS